MTTVSPTALTKTERVVCQLFLLALFCVSFSTALTNFFVGLSYIGFLVALAASPSLRAMLRLPPRLLAPGLAALLLLALYLLGMTWSIAPHADLLTAVKKYTRLLILPMGIVLAWRAPGLPRRALAYYLAGTGVLAVSIYLASFGLMPSSSLGWWRVSADKQDLFVFRNHITIGIMLGFASSACLLIATYVKDRRRVIACAAALATALPIVFLSGGRTGYVVLFIGLVTVFLLRARLTPLRMTGGLAALVLLFAGLYLASPNMKTRTDEMVKEIETEAPRTPNGLRLSFIKVGLDVVAAHPLIGIGTGGFAEAYAPTALRTWPAGHPMATERYQPHSEFVLTAVQLGVVGLAAYFGMLAALGLAALGRRSFERDLLALLWLIYTITSAYNSLLWDTSEAHWFLLLSSCLYVAAMRQRAGLPAAAAAPGPQLVPPARGAA